MKIYVVNDGENGLQLCDDKGQPIENLLNWHFAERKGVRRVEIQVDLLEGDGNE